MEREQYRKIIYCDWQFLELLLSKLGKNKPSDNNSLDIDSEIATCIMNLIMSFDVKLFLNIKNEIYNTFLTGIEQKRIIASKENSKPQWTPFENLINEIESKRQDGKLHLHLNSSQIDFDNLQDEESYLNAIFFCCEPKEVCQKAMEQFGVIVFCLDNINDFKFYFSEQGTALRKNEKSSWEMCLCKEGIVPCNSIILVDNYILNDTNNINNNLKEIFESLIPKNICKKIVFHITIFTTLRDEKGGKNYPSEPRIELLNEMLKEIREDVTFSVSIIKCSKDNFHDRNIITNNLYISCGGGFDIFKDKKANKITTICMLNPFMNTQIKWSRKAYSDLINEFRKLFQNSPVFGKHINDSFPNFAIGQKINRLISTNY